MFKNWPLWWKILAAIGTAIVGTAGIISAYYTVKGYYYPPNPPAQNAAQPAANNQSATLTYKNPIKRDSNKLAHSQNPPTQEELIETTKTIPAPQIYAPNGVVSVNQQGGITANTVNINKPIKKYSFSGAMTIIEGNRIAAYQGEKADAFNKLLTLEKERQYTELLAVCKKEIAETPEWLTPYLFQGVAQANMGLENDAISSFKYVITKTTSDPDLKNDRNFQQAKAFLDIIQGKAK